IDTVFGPKAKENEETRALLNAGHRRGAVAGRCVVRGKTVETEEIPAYCAVALAGSAGCPTQSYRGRSSFECAADTRAGPSDPIAIGVIPVRGIHCPILWRGWAKGATKALADARPDMPAGVEDRAADCWEPLLAIADAVGGEWPEWARKAAVSLVSAAREAEPSLGIRLLADCRTVFGEADIV